MYLPLQIKAIKTIDAIINLIHVPNQIVCNFIVIKYNFI